MARKRDDIDDQIRAHRGFIPWTAQEYDSVLAEFIARRKTLKGNLPLTAEFAHLKDERDSLSGPLLFNFNSMLLVSDIFHHRYPNEIQYNAHFMRFHEISNFLNEYNDELMALKLISMEGGMRQLHPKLLESLCTLPYSQMDEASEDLHCTFLYEEVIKITQAKIQSHLN